MQADYQHIRNAEFSELVNRTVKKGKKVNILSEELYMEYELKYIDNTVEKIRAARREVEYDVAKTMLAEGATVEFRKITGISRDELLAMEEEVKKQGI